MAMTKTKRRKRFTDADAPGLTPVDFIYRRLTGDSTGFAPIWKAPNMETNIPL